MEKRKLAKIPSEEASDEMDFQTEQQALTSLRLER